MGEEVIVLTDLTKKYGSFTAVDHICLSVGKGEIFGLLGPNGRKVDYDSYDARTNGTYFGQRLYLWY